MSEFDPEQGSRSEVFPDIYVFEAIDRLRNVKWNNSLYPTILHNPYQKQRIHTDVIDNITGEIYHLSTHPHFLDLPKNTPLELIPGYGFRDGGPPSPIVSLTNRRTETPTHLLMPNFEGCYQWLFGEGLSYGIVSREFSRAGNREEELEFKELFERIAPLKIN